MEKMRRPMEQENKNKTRRRTCQDLKVKEPQVRNWNWKEMKEAGPVVKMMKEEKREG